MNIAEHTAAPPAQVNIKDVVALTARLAQVMAEEVDMLAAMKISKIESLQKEKLFLIGALESQKKLVEKHPDFGETIPSQDKQDLQKVVDIFNDILEENHRKLLLAKSVNHRIVEAITDAVKENTQRSAYDKQGISGTAPFDMLSVTLDKKI